MAGTSSLRTDSYALPSLRRMMPLQTLPIILGHGRPFPDTAVARNVPLATGSEGWRPPVGPPVSGSQGLLPLAFSHSLRVLLELREEESYATTKSLARSHGIPAFHLAKILQTLTHAGILGSKRGAAGGFRLSRPAHQIYLAEILAPFPHQGAPGWLVHPGPCDLECPCVFHNWWKVAQELIDHMLQTTTLRDIQLTVERRETMKLNRHQDLSPNSWNEGQLGDGQFKMGL